MNVPPWVRSSTFDLWHCAGTQCLGFVSIFGFGLWSLQFVAYFKNIPPFVSLVSLGDYSETANLGE